jgi:hypothetical protein
MLYDYGTGLLENQDGVLVDENDGNCCCPESRCCNLGTPLTGTLSLKTGAAESLPDEVTFTQVAPPEGVTYKWNTGPIASPCPGAPTWGMTLECRQISDTESRWTLVGAVFTGIVASLASVDCDERVVEFDVTINDGAGCTGSFHIIITGPP